MNPRGGYLSLFFKMLNGNLAGLTRAYVDDTIITWTRVFEKESEKTEARFGSKPGAYCNFTFAGILVKQSDDGHLMHQEIYCLEIQPLT